MQKRQEPNVSDHSKHSVFIYKLYHQSTKYAYASMTVNKILGTEMRTELLTDLY